jgi:hypothetical protein
MKEHTMKMTPDRLDAANTLKEFRSMAFVGETVWTAFAPHVDDEHRRQFDANRLDIHAVRRGYLNSGNVAPVQAWIDEHKEVFDGYLRFIAEGNAAN